MPTLGQALSDYRELLFVGREAEIAAFEYWLYESPASPSILNISGIGGSGKTELLQAFVRHLRRIGVPFKYLDGRSVRHSQADLATALEPLRQVPPSVADQPSFVLMVDTYEEIGQYDRWFRDSFLSHLESSVRVVLAGRFPIARLWMASGGWAQLIRTLSVGPLTKSAARDYLWRRGITDDTLVEQVWSFTRGHPLALCLATDLALRMGYREFATTPQRYPFLQDMAQLLLDEVSSRELRDLLEAAAMVRQFDEALLAALIDTDRLSDAFEQLCRLSFVKPAPHGLAVHDVIRRTMTHELRWRNPGRFAELRARALAFYSARFRDAAPDDRHWLVADWLSFSTRALVQHLISDEIESGEIIVQPATAEDRPAILRLRAERSAIDDPDPVLQSPSTRLMVARNWDGDLLGFSVVIPVCRATLSWLAENPRAAMTLRSRLDTEELSDVPGSPEAADTFIIWNITTGRQAPPSVQPALIRDLIGLLARGKHYLILTAVPDQQVQLMALGFQPFPEASFDAEQRGEPLNGLELDLRSIGPERWVEAVLSGKPLTDRGHELSTDLQPAVQDALSHWSDDALLAASPLARYASVSETAPLRDRAKAVRDVLGKAFNDLKNAATGNDRDVLRAVDLAYLQRSTSHERLAERLSVSRSTLYRMLNRGCRLLAGRISLHG